MTKNKACDAYDRYHDKHWITNAEMHIAMRSFYAGWKAAKQSTRRKKK